ncbi:MAGUK p55 subfamily member 7-like [Panonychus citri]|uniref:MAGUK p55 subfamily member 7-like n=1 Tax=Panonychus citri TaxID=50023 RepID=UPI002307A583|nr:MAGUK p55 subfamily member 7-like [Panonychus citri]
MTQASNEAYELVLESLRNLVTSESSRSVLTQDKSEIKSVVTILDGQKIRPLASICSDFLENKKNDHKWTPMFLDGFQMSIDVRDSLTKEWIDEAQSLCKILNNEHLQALLWTHDIVANKQFEPSLPEEEYEDSSMEFYPNYDDEMASVKIVQVIKNQEPLGATVTFEDQTGNIVISRVIYGGAAHRSGLINVGDCILEVNGYSLKGRSFMEILTMLEHECRNSIISFKLLPGDYGSSGRIKSELTIRVKALFDYFPSQDPNHPCPEAGLSFKKGDILHIVNMDEDDWWQARREDDSLDIFYYSVIHAGLIPSKSLQEKRIVASRDIRDLREFGRLKKLKLNHPLRYKIRRSLNKYRKVKKMMYRVKDADELGREDISTYLEVSLLKSSTTHSTYRPLVFIAPYPLDTNRLLDTLIDHDSKLFTRPVPHTTRSPAEWERDGFDYYFVSTQWFLDEIKCSRFPEYGQFQQDYYGIHITSILRIIEKGQLCLLNPNPRALKLLYSPIIKPYIVFLRPSYDLLFQKSSKFIPLCINSDHLPVQSIDLKQMALNSMKLEYLYSHYFDRILIVEDVEQIKKCLFDTVKLINIEDQWVPASWIPE